MSQDARQDEEIATFRRSRILGLPYINTSQIANKTLYKDLISKDELYKLKVIPIIYDPHHISFGVTNTTSQATINNLRQRYMDQQTIFSLISDAGYREYMNLYDPPKKVVYENIALKSVGNKELQSSVSATLEQVRADDILAYLVQQAHQLNSSDIHLENQKDDVRIRFRIDGVLHSITQLSHEKYRVLVAAIASAANVSTASREAQQGHIATKIMMADKSTVDVNVRLETVPTINGMDMVMRLFNMDQSMYTLDRLGLTDSERKTIDEIINRPSGLVLVVGPTGSGKTTTIYSMLNSLNTEERKIITIEDPVEYQFSGICQISVTTQTAVQSSFADKLRVVLRLDPDIIMVGEIRDSDTAKTALQASLTGHLVLSTFHASSSATALTRMMDVIGTNPLFVSAIRLVMAQRLVRRLDDATKVAYQPDESTMKKIKEVIDSLPTNVARPDLAVTKFYKAGKSEENPYGFKGQIAIREQFKMTGEIRQIMEHSEHVLSSQDIEAAAIKSGMSTLLQDGILKVCQGLTTSDEVFRVVG